MSNNGNPATDMSPTAIVRRVLIANDTRSTLAPRPLPTSIMARKIVEGLRTKGYRFTSVAMLEKQAQEIRELKFRLEMAESRS